MLNHLVAITVSITIPHNKTTRPNEPHSWTEFGTMEELIALRDPFHNRNEISCGTIRPLASIGKMFSQLQDNYPSDYRIVDDVVMEFWESRDDVLWWTPMCSARSDLVRVGL